MLPTFLFCFQQLPQLSFTDRAQLLHLLLLLPAKRAQHLPRRPAALLLLLCLCDCFSGGNLQPLYMMQPALARPVHSWQMLLGRRPGERTHGTRAAAQAEGRIHEEELCLKATQ